MHDHRFHSEIRFTPLSVHLLPLLTPLFLGPSLFGCRRGHDSKLCFVITIDETIFRVLDMFFTARFRNHFTRSGCYATPTT